MTAMPYVVIVLVVAGTAAVLIGAMLHHARSFAYPRYKGRAVPHGFGWSLRHELEAYAVLAWWHVLALLRDGLRSPEQVCGRPVVFVHGYSQDATNFHGHRRRLERAGRPTAA